MPTTNLVPWELKSPGTYTTQSSAPITGPVALSAALVMNDEDVLSESPVTHVTRLTLEGSTNGGQTWGVMGHAGGWSSGPHNEGINGNPPARFGVSKQIPDAVERIYRLVVDLPDEILAGAALTWTVS